MRIKKPTRPKKSERPTRGTAARAILLVGICVMGAAILMAARQPSKPTDSATGQEKVGAVDAYARKEAALKTPGAGAVPAAIPGADGKAGKASAAKSAPVTITGCLEKADDTFRLKDTSGADVPKARSWKSDFLKKSSAAIEVVDSSNKLKLPTHIGQRVSVTGTLVDREMQVRSLQRVAASCNKNSGA